MLKQPRQHSEKHLTFIRGLPCLRCLDNTGTEAAHIRYPSPKAGKRQVGKGEKPDDKWTVPLCNRHHHEQHRVGETAFWIAQDQLFVALALWGATGNHEIGEQIVNENCGAHIAVRYGAGSW
jgi:hypothetical protein